MTLLLCIASFIFGGVLGFAIMALLAATAPDPGEFPQLAPPLPHDGQPSN